MRISDWSSDVCSSDLASDSDTEALRLSGHVPIDGVSSRPARCRAQQKKRAQGPSYPPPRRQRHHVVADHEVIEQPDEIGRASCRERVCQYVWTSVVAVSLKTKKINEKLS